MDPAVSPIDLTIVVVNWNACAYLRGCLRSIIEQTRVCAYEIVVVDNNSTDGSQQMLTEEFPDVIGILNGTTGASPRPTTRDCVSHAAVTCC